MKNTTYWILGAAAVNVAAMAIWGNPLMYFMEAGPSAYYQARVAYERGTDKEKATVVASFQDQKITMREYSDSVFPAYAETIPEKGEFVFPAAEKAKSKDQLRAELAKTITH